MHESVPVICSLPLCTSLTYAGKTHARPGYAWSAGVGGPSACAPAQQRDCLPYTLSRHRTSCPRASVPQKGACAHTHARTSCRAVVRWRWVRPATTECPARGHSVHGASGAVHPRAPGCLCTTASRSVVSVSVESWHWSCTAPQGREASYEARRTCARAPCVLTCTTTRPRVRRCPTLLPISWCTMRHCARARSLGASAPAGALP